MIRTLLLLITLSITFSPPIFAKIIESQTIADVLDYVDEETLVIFGINNTLIHSTRQVGSPAWFDHKVRQRMEIDQISEVEAMDSVMPLWAKVIRNTYHQPVEKCTPVVLSKLQARAARVIAITRRPVEMAYPTIDLLARYGMHLSKESGYMEIRASYHATYIEGIIFQGPKNNKSEVLDSYLKCDKLNFKTVVIIDDRFDQLQTLCALFEKLEIPCVGIRLSTLDEMMAQIDFEAEERKWKDFFRSQLDLPGGGLQRAVEPLSQRQAMHLPHH